MGRYIKAGIVGGIILFIWGCISWMVLPWHMATLHHFTDEKAVSQVLETNAPQSGMYFTPSMEAQATNTAESMPSVFSAVKLKAHTSMTVPMIISFLTQVVAAMLVAWLLGRVRLSGYVTRLVFVVVFALAAGVVTEVPYWNWFGFDLNYTLVQMADLLAGWFLAGLVLARMVRNNS